MGFEMTQSLPSDERESILKIDGYTTLGLAGTNNSLAYRVHEIEKHFHSMERWYGTDGDGTGSVANNMTEWQLTAGTSSAFGTEVQLLAADDVNATDFNITPVKFDMHRVFVTASSINDKNYIIQFWAGTGTFGEASLLTEVPYRTGSNVAEVAPIEVQMPRLAVNSKVWARVKCETNAGTLDFIVGIHAYQG